jgi:hypothetical protein
MNNKTDKQYNDDFIKMVYHIFSQPFPMIGADKDEKKDKPKTEDSNPVKQGAD